MFEDVSRGLRYLYLGDWASSIFFDQSCVRHIYLPDTESQSQKEDNKADKTWQPNEDGELEGCGLGFVAFYGELDLVVAESEDI